MRPTLTNEVSWLLVIAPHGYLVGMGMSICSATPGKETVVKMICTVRLVIHCPLQIKQRIFIVEVSVPQDSDHDTIWKKHISFEKA